MTSLERLIARLKRQRAEADLRDVVRVLEAMGWERRGQRGSHVVFVKANERSLVFPVVGGRSVKRYYVVDLLERLELDD